MLKSLSKYIVGMALAFAAPAAAALPADTYATSSTLAQGRWVKIGVPQSGLYQLSRSTLRGWGFSDPAKVRVYGYGGRRIADQLSSDNYVDDLPLVASELTDAGIVFYGAGPETWTASTGNYCHAEQSPYATLGYYFITEADSVAPAIPATGYDGPGTPATTAQGRAHIEQDVVQATEAGPLFVGDDFRSTRTRRYTVETPGRVASENVWMECQFVHRHTDGSAQLRFDVDDTTLPTVSTDRVPATSTSTYVHASLTTTRNTFTAPKAAEKFDITLTYTPTRTVTLANLDYMSFNYTVDLALPSQGWLNFWSSGPCLSFAGDRDVRIWDVTDPHAVERVDYAVKGDRLQWYVSRAGWREYVAWRPGVSLPTPKYVESMRNQNLHADTEPVDMVIFSPAAFTAQAERIAELHRVHDGLEVRVVDPQKVYNEFSSGAADVSGLRKYLKMVYDRSAGSAHPLQFALLLGRPTLDHRSLLESTRRMGYPMVPSWVVKAGRLSMSDNDGYGTDDFLAMLEDNQGTDLSLDILSVAVGRIPMTSAATGSEIVDKLADYMTKSKRTSWKNRMLLLADDEDQAIHMRQMEAFAQAVRDTPQLPNVMTKVYIDAYQRQNGTYPEARREMFGALNDGVVWWYFTGHANNHSWTGDGMLSFSDINSMYLRNVPFVVAATCDFLRWDSEVESGGEIMYKERYGGSIGMVSATRPVYINENAYFLSAMGRNTLARDTEGLLKASGTIYRDAKNDIRNLDGTRRPNPNRLRYVFMGDPALKLATPSNLVELLTIDGQAVTPEAEVTVGALANATVTGRVVSPDGSPLSDFNGTVSLELFDAETSRITNGYGDDGNGKQEPFDAMGDKLFAGSAKVENGRFSARIAMPSLIADNYRPATLSMYAAADNSQAEAVGVNSDFFVYGFDENAEPDDISPIIASMMLNHSDFEEGDIVNDSPMLMAAVSDNVGINLSTSGVGQQMAITVDGNKWYTDVASFYTPAADGSPSGTISYPLKNLADGAHSMRLRVFDTSGNMAERTIDFNVSANQPPSIFDVFTDANPASSTASFYVRHDRPETLVEVGIEIFDLLGRPVWSSVRKGMSDLDLSSPVTWDLTDRQGRRVQRGIYLYRATLSTGHGQYQTATRRIAVTAR